MKRHLLLATILAFSSLGAKAFDPAKWASSVTFSPAGLICLVIFGEIPSGNELGDGIAALTCVGLSSTTATTAILLKEMHEVKSDAAAFAAGEEASLALQSVVEKFQVEASLQGIEPSFEEVVDAINTL